ncbi:hypothetical protein FNV43_RR07974 [Rhamnella rubrinervis]|uniref:RNase H type-1 domain-containing protein n=1 Tax=Rhamnella rubrinervis TaxID=2594499 RepID=A0A8K0HGX6_9ROSA|nr:hypothetical protein FNV43_RR07974 [Rhamnella rubrinervis]
MGDSPSKPVDGVEQGNEHRHSGQRRIEDFVSLMNDNVMDFYNASLVRPDKAGIEKATETWTPPPSNFLKANTDAAYREGRTALAFVLRDEGGNIIYLASKLERAASPLEAEFMALEWALKLSEANYWSNITWSADSQDMVKAINAVEDPAQWDTGYLALGCRKVLGSKKWKLNWNSRTSNLLADSLAKRSLQSIQSFLFSGVLESFSSLSSCFSLIVR